MARLPVNNVCNLFGVLWVNEDVIIMKVIMPEGRVGDGSVLRGKKVDDVSIPFKSSKFLLFVWLVKLRATE